MMAKEMKMMRMMVMRRMRAVTLLVAILVLMRAGQVQVVQKAVPEIGECEISTLVGGAVAGSMILSRAEVVVVGV